MTTEGRQPIGGAISPLPTERSGERLERLREESGLTWRKLAARFGVNDHAALSGTRTPTGTPTRKPRRNCP